MVEMNMGGGAALSLVAMLSFSLPAISQDATNACEFANSGRQFRVGGTRTHDGPPILDEDFLGNFIYDSSNNERVYFTIALDPSDGTVGGTVFAAQGTPLHDYVATRGARCVGKAVVVNVSGFYVAGSCFHRMQWNIQAYVDADRSLVVTRYQTDEYGRFCSKTSTMSTERTRYRPYKVIAE
ncbi:hypothetical protein [Rhizobacter sp. P5_C2]